jgi:aspartate 1-decarboxylase
LNGAAAREFEPNDQVIILHFAMMGDTEYAAHRPRVALMNPDNSIREVIRYEPDPAGPKHP